MKTHLLLLGLIATTTAFAQTTADFEAFNLQPGETLNNAENDVFISGNVSLFNDYNEDYGFWSGWAISADTDTETPGFMNDLSSASGGGAQGSTTYAVTYAFEPQTIDLIGDAAGAPVAGMYVNNNTYAYLGIRDGVGPATRFGGETGDDPDFFLLTIKGSLNGQLTTDSIDFYLADYRFADNTQDYIVNEWTYLDLTGLGNVDQLVLSLSSSDNGEFGMNTPAYVCVDNITTTDMPLNVRDERLDWNVEVFPNPTSRLLTVNWPSATSATATVYNTHGQALHTAVLTPGANAIDVADLPAGRYVLRCVTEEGWSVQGFVKG